MRVKSQKKKVEVFNLEDSGALEMYEDILNNPKITVIRDAHTYDKLGKSKITVWYQVEED